MLEGLTTEVGQRLAGHRGRGAGARLGGAAADRARLRATSMSSRSTCRSGCAARSGPRSSRPSRSALVVTALGNSGATPARGHRGRGRRLRQRRRAARRRPTRRCAARSSSSPTTCRPTQDGSGYGPFGAPRRQGPTIASRKGAVGDRRPLDRHRLSPQPAYRRAELRPRACGRSRPARSPSPTPSSCSASSRRGQPVRMRLTLTPRNIGRRQSGNVVAEVPGTRSRAPA